MQDQLRALIAKHCSWLSAQVADIAACMDHLNSGTSGGGADVRPAIELIHQISGTSGSMGFRAISERAMELEEHLLEIEKMNGLPDDARYARAHALFGALRDAANGVAPESSSLYNVDLARL
jgi:HPt (histidine-containing phosphotransfer) domain-containing protein